MREETKNVATKGKIVGQVTVPVYETLAELTDTESEERILSMFNKQNAVRIMGNERAKHSEARAGKKKRAMLAYNLLTTDEAVSAAGDYDKLQTLLNSDAVQARVDEYLGGAGEGEQVEDE